MGPPTDACPHPHSRQQWCGHCKRLEPEWAAAAELLAAGADPAAIVLAKLDATEEKNTELAKAHDIKAGPGARGPTRRPLLSSA